MNLVRVDGEWDRDRLQGTTTHTKKEEENVAGLISAVMASMINEAH